ncbi:MAG: hypothetical protein CMJ49_00160 [Planctomycetaceae bacterium]|nr:hypothetical protein [Planctomycetaceae bacterium]
MRYLVKGLDREDGKPIEVTIDALSENDAIHKAADQGIVVASVERFLGPPREPPVGPTYLHPTFNVSNDKDLVPHYVGGCMFTLVFSLTCIAAWVAFSFCIVWIVFEAILAEEIPEFTLRRIVNLILVGAGIIYIVTVISGPELYGGSPHCCSRNQRL